MTVGTPVPRPRYWRRIIQIKAEDSPNVQMGLYADRMGLVLDEYPEIIHGVIGYKEYLKRRALFDPIRQCIGLDAEFYEGNEVKLFPPLWINRAAALARRLVGQRRRAKAIGIDPGEGVEDTSWAVIDELGLIELIAKKTDDTSVITGDTLAIMRRYKVPPYYVCFDRGGGGKQHADRLRLQGFPVRTVSFGEPLNVPIKYGETLVKDRIVNQDEKYAYFNRRAEMYGTVRQLLDPINKGFAIPAQYVRLRQEMLTIPLTYDEEGRLYLLPKNKKDPDSTKKTLIELIGHSPNDADALAVAVYAMTHKPVVAIAGSVI